MPIVLLLALVSSAFPSNSRTSWMAPQSFRLTIGMARSDAEKTLRDAGWNPKPGRDHNQIVVDYTEEKSLTLEFGRDRLRSVRFELFALIPDIRAAFAEQRTMLKKEHGAPKKLKSPSLVVYDNRLPNIMVVLSDDPRSEYGKRGFGFLAVRYYDPVWAPNDAGNDPTGQRRPPS